jgi:hypothetical protein
MGNAGQIAPSSVTGQLVQHNHALLPILNRLTNEFPSDKSRSTSD